MEFQFDSNVTYGYFNDEEFTESIAIPAFLTTTVQRVKSEEYIRNVEAFERKLAETREIERHQAVKSQEMNFTFLIVCGLIVGYIILK